MGWTESQKLGKVEPIAHHNENISYYTPCVNGNTFRVARFWFKWFHHLKKNRIQLGNRMVFIIFVHQLPIQIPSIKLWSKSFHTTTGWSTTDLGHLKLLFFEAVLGATGNFQRVHPQIHDKKWFPFPHIYFYFFAAGMSSRWRSLLHLIMSHRDLLLTIILSILSFLCVSYASLKCSAISKIPSGDEVRDGIVVAPRCIMLAKAVHRPLGYLFNGIVLKPCLVRCIFKGGGNVFVVFMLCSVRIISLRCGGGPTTMRVVGFGAIAP